MKYKKTIILATLLLACLLAVSAVNASEDVSNTTIDDSVLEINEISDSYIESTDNELNFNEKDENNILQSTDDNITSMNVEEMWFNDKVIWYEGDWDNIDNAFFEFPDELQDSDSITVYLSYDDNPVANVDLALLDDYDNKITKLTTDSNGIAVYNIPFDVEKFSFCIGFWYDENSIISYMDMGSNLIYSFGLKNWTENGLKNYWDDDSDDDWDDDWDDDSDDDWDDDDYDDSDDDWDDDDYDDSDDSDDEYDASQFYNGNRISLGPLSNYIPEVPDPTIPFTGITIDFTKPIVDSAYPRVIDLSNYAIGEDAMNKYGSVELNGRDLVIKSLNRDNYTVFAEISGKYYDPYSYESNGRGSYDVHISLNDVSQGNHDVIISVFGDSKFDFIYRINYYPVVRLILPIYINSGYAISASSLTTYYGGGYSVVLTNRDIPVANANVQMVINGQVQNVKTGSDGRASIILPVGEYDLISSYNDVSASSSVTVLSTITTSNATGEYLNSKVTSTFLDTAGKALAYKQVTFKVGDEIYSATTNANGVATANIPLSVGTYTVTAINPANKEEKQFILMISKANSEISLSSSQNKGIVTLTATLTPTSATGNVAFSFAGQNKYVAIKNGVATLTLNNLEPGDYVVTANYLGDNNLYASSSNAATFTVEEVYPVLTASDFTKTYGTSNKFIVNLADSNGNAIANAVVNVEINNKITQIKTDSNGKASMPISLKPNKYTAIISYADAQATANIVVKKATPKLTASAKTIKITDKTKKYTVTLKTNKNKAMKKTKVTLIVNKIKYSTKTNNKGVATFKLTKLTKKGKYKAVVKYAGDKCYNAKTVKPKITVK